MPQCNPANSFSGQLKQPDTMTGANALSLNWPGGNFLPITVQVISLFSSPVAWRTTVGVTRERHVLMLRFASSPLISFSAQLAQPSSRSEMASSPCCTEIELPERGAKSGLANASIPDNEHRPFNVHAGPAFAAAAGNLPDVPTARPACPRSQTTLVYVGKLQRWWSINISLVLDHDHYGSSGDDPRDYLALERTFLGWVRTSTALISLGVITTQLFILRGLDPTKGKIFGTTIAFASICISLLGCIRYFRLQILLARGKTLSAGWHPILLLALLSLIMLSLFVVILIED